MSLMDFSSEEIEGRIIMGEFLAAQLRGDPVHEAQEALSVVEGQIQELRDELERRGDRPQPIVIGLKTAHTKAVLPGGK